MQDFMIVKADFQSVFTKWLDLKLDRVDEDNFLNFKTETIYFIQYLH